MDVRVEEPKTRSAKKCSDNLHNASSVLSVVAILLTIALFLRMEINTQMLDSKFSLEIQQIKDTLKSEQASYHLARVKDDVNIQRGK